MPNEEYRPDPLESEAMQDFLTDQPKQAENIHANREHQPVAGIPLKTSDRVANCNKEAAAGREIRAIRLAQHVLPEKRADAEPLALPLEASK